MQKGDDNPYAYVTYETSVQAHVALEALKYDDKLRVIPADTWHQPIDETAEKERQLEDLSINGQLKFDETATTSLSVGLNDDCLMHIFQYCDLDTIINVSKVDQRLHDFAHQMLFNHYKTYKIDFCEAIESETDDIRLLSLAKARRHLRYIGKNLTELKFIHYAKEAHVTRIMYKWQQYARSVSKYRIDIRTPKCPNLLEKFWRITERERLLRKRKM